MAGATFSFGEDPRPLTAMYQGLFADGVIPVDGTYLLGRPDVRNAIFPGLREEQYLTQFLFDTGRRKVTVNSVFWHFEDKDLIQAAQIKSKSGTPGAGNKVTITIEARTDKESPFKLWDTVVVGGVPGWIAASTDITLNSSTGEHQYAITPIDNTDDIVTAATAQAYVIWFGTAKADGTAQPPPMVSKPVKYSGKTQIIASSYESEGSAAADRTAIKVSSRTSKKYGYVRGLDELYKRHMMALSHTFILGKKNVGLTDPGKTQGATEVRTTEGFETGITNYGNNFTGTDFNYDTLVQINKKLDAENAPNEYLALCGNNFKYNLDATFMALGIAWGGTSYDPFRHTQFTKWGASDPKQRMLDLGIDGLKIGNRSFYFKVEPTLYYRGTLGATGLSYPEKAYFLPYSFFMDKKTNELSDVIQIRYKAGDLEDRFMQESEVNWQKSETGIDLFKWFMRSEAGWHQAKYHWAAQYTPDTSGS